jgi:hypothetical protein
MTDEQELPAYPIRAYQLIPDPNQPTVVALAIETDQATACSWPRGRFWKISARICWSGRQGCRSGRIKSSGLHRPYRWRAGLAGAQAISRSQSV